MKIWSLKSTLYSLQSRVINLVNLHFINNTCSYSLKYPNLDSITNIWKRKKGREKTKRFKLNGKFQNWKKISEDLKISELLLDVWRLLFTDQIIKNSQCVRWSTDLAKHLFQNMRLSLRNAHPRFFNTWLGF